MTPIRPKFSNPPLIERAISIAFSRIQAFTLGDYGLFWSELLNEFPASEAMPPLPVEIEQFDGFHVPHMAIQLFDPGSIPRAAFRNAASGELLQIQPDRFGFNWIKTGDDHEYPHSEATLKRFFHFFEIFSNFVKNRGLGEISIVQCELTNVNIIPVSDVGESFSDVATVIRLPHVASETSHIRLESQIVGSKHVMLNDEGKPIGRIHALGQPSLRVPSNEEAFRLDICARGAPLGSGPEGAQMFFHEATSAINAVFLASITKAGRQFWGEQHG